METIILFTCSGIEADEIRARLEAENIPVALLTHSESVATTVAGGLANMDVCVRAEDRQRAMEVLGMGLGYARGERSLVRARYIQQNYQRQTAAPGEALPAPRPAAYLRQMLLGLAWLLGGVALTWLTLQSGSLRVFFVGAILYGLYQFITGLLGWWRARK